MGKEVQGDAEGRYWALVKYFFAIDTPFKVENPETLPVEAL